MGRPTKLTDELRERYEQAVAAGIVPETAARQLGVSPATLYRWLKGRTPRQAAFRDGHERALASFEIRLTATVSRAALEDPKVALEVLRQRFPTRWGRASITESTAVADDPAETIVDVDPAYITQVVPLLLEAGRSMAGTPIEPQDVDMAVFEDDGRSPVPDESETDEQKDLSA
jgi:transposase-like protein